MTHDACRPRLPILWRPSPVLLSASVCLLLLGCERDPSPAAREDVAAVVEKDEVDSAFFEHFERTSNLVFEETKDVLHVEPIVVRDGTGRLLVVEPKENQVRVYSATGQLTGYFGRKGSGPGELNGPVMARRLPNGDIVVANVMDTRLQQYDSAGAQLVAEHRAPEVQPIIDFLPVAGSRFIAARFGATKENLFLIDSGVVLRRFMPTPSTQLARKGGSTFGSVALAQRGDTIAALHALADTIYLFRLDGEAAGTVALPFKQSPDQVRETSTTATAQELAAAFAGIRRNVSLFWLNDGSFAVVTARQALDRRITWGVLHTTRAGEPLFESARTPRLLTVLDSTFYFRDPAFPEPNKWFTARLSRSR